MEHKTHSLGGITAGCIVLTSSVIVLQQKVDPVFEIIPFLGSAIIGASWPDIDDVRSYIGRRLWFISWIYFFIQKIICFFIKNPKSKLLKNIRRGVNHRGFAHWPINYLIIDVFLLICYYYLQLIYKDNFTFFNFYKIGDYDFSLYSKIFSYKVLLNIGYGFTIGALSHSFLDCYNPTGITLLAPFSFESISFGNIETGGNFERFIFRNIMRVCTVMSIAILFTSIGLKNNLYEIKDLQNIYYNITKNEKINSIKYKKQIHYEII